MKNDYNVTEKWEYPCDKCGACCRKVGLVEEMKKYDRGDGVCKYLTEDNLCSIYDNRPKICNTKLYYLMNLRKKQSWEEFVKESRKGCKALQDIEKL